jgi:hypothetical protein
MDDLLLKALATTGPCLTSDLARVLTEQHALSPEAARQRVSRRPKSVRSIPRLPFPKNARFVYHQNDYGAPRFWRALEAAMRETSPAYASALQALAERGGIMPQRHFLIACGAPIAQKKQVASEVILARLIEAGLFEVVEVPGIGECVSYARAAEYLDDPVAAMRSRLIVEEIVLNAVKSWARNLGLGSFGRFLTRNDQGEVPQVGTFAWDLSAPSYLGALTSVSGDGTVKPGFVVCDILLGRQISETGLRPFIRKCTMLRELKRVGRCLQIFVGDGYSTPSFQLARGSGIVAATPESLFGEDVALALVELTRTLRGAASAAVDPEKIDYLFRHLGKIEGAANSLRGALFEFVVADMVRKLWPANVAMNRVFRAGGRDIAEVDVLAVIPNQSVHFIECKGHAPGGVVDDAEVEVWLKRRIPLLRKQALEHPDWRHLDLHFELWTSGQLSALSVQKISEVQEKFKSLGTIRIRTRSEIEAVSASLNDKGLLKVLQQHFFEHPLATGIASHDGLPTALYNFNGVGLPAATTDGASSLISATPTQVPMISGDTDVPF